MENKSLIEFFAIFAKKKGVKRKKGKIRPSGLKGSKKSSIKIPAKSNFRNYNLDCPKCGKRVLD